jgi:hypothetical protein
MTHIGTIAGQVGPVAFGVRCNSDDQGASIISAGIAHIEQARQGVRDLAFKDIDVLVLPTTVTATPSITRDFVHPDGAIPGENLCPAVDRLERRC